MRIEGKTIAITGAATGIGRATAIRLAEEGAARLLLIDVNAAALADTADEVSARKAQPDQIILDLSDLHAVEATFTRIEDVGGFDILFNNAGIVSGANQFPDAGNRAIRNIIDVNLTSLILSTELSIRILSQRGGGTIVNTVSTVALGTGFHDILYSTSKAGVHMFVQACASIHERHNVRVLSVLPGLVDTPILHKTGGEGITASWMLPILQNNEACLPDDIASAVLDLIRRDEVPGGSWVAVRREHGRVIREWSRPELS